MMNQASRLFIKKLLSAKKIPPYPIAPTVSIRSCEYCKLHSHSQLRWNSDLAGLKSSAPENDVEVFKSLDAVKQDPSTDLPSASLVDTEDQVQLNSAGSETAIYPQVKKMTALEKLKRLDELLPKVSESFNLATFVNRSPVLQQLVKLGVNVSEYDKDVEKACYVLLLDFETDVKPHLFFLHHLGVPVERWATILTKNPFLLKEDLDVLKARVQYLISKKFSQADIATLASYPNWLSHSIESIDSKLGFLQKLFKLTGNEVRAVAVRLPRIVFSDQMTIREVRHLLMDEFELTPDQLKKILLENPRVFHLCKHQTKAKMKLIRNKMKIPVDFLVKCNKMLTYRLHVLDNRHYFLKSLGRAQYDPKLPRYVSPVSLAIMSDEQFATQLAESSLEAYYLFQKTL